MNITNQNAKRAAAALTATALLLAVSWGARPALAAPTMPVITTPAQSTSTNPILLTGTADATTTITVTGGASAASTTADVSGEWSVSVSLTPDSVNNLSVVSTDGSASTSATSTVAITHFTATSTPDTTAPAAPVITFPISPYTTTANAVLVTGTAEGDSTVSFDNGSGAATTTATSGGAFSAMIALPSGTTTTYFFTATDAAGNTSSSTSLVITQTATSTATSSPVITLLGDNPTNVFSCNGYTDAGATAVSATGTALTVASTTDLDIEQAGTYAVVYTATDSEGNTASSTRTVLVLNCSSGGGSSGGSSRPADNTAPGLSHAMGSVRAGIIIGPSFQVPGVPSTAGEVLGASAALQFTFTLRMGMSGPEVFELQRRLAETGYFNGPLTGYFGPKTRASLMRLQRANGLAATGELDGPTIVLFNS